jgi:DNA helicase-2/ATP-dependent DNA helicase PcrA
MGINVGYTILTQVEAWMFFQSHLFDFKFDYYRPFGNPTKFIGAVLSFFGKLQDENVVPDEYNAFAKKLPDTSSEEATEKKRHLELAKAYEKYLALKIEKNVFEFSDLHYQVLKLFRERPNVLARVRTVWTHILVDEFQDTNLIQFELIKLLSGDGSNLTVVADDDQSIYAFRGSNISNILGFTKTYPNTEKISLTENYRSPQVLLDRAYQLIQYNNPDRLEVKESIVKKLTSGRGHAGDVIFSQFSKDSDEVKFVVDRIEAELADGVPLSDIALLVRANSYADPFTEELQFRGIPYQYLGLKGLYEREEVKDLLCFLRFLRNPHETSVVFRLMKLKCFRFEMDEILMLLNESRSRKKPLWLMLSGVDHKKAKHFTDTLKRFLDDSRNERAGSVLYEFVSACIYPELLENPTVENEKKIHNINAFFERIKRFESSHSESDAVHLIDFLDLVIEAGENPATADGMIDADAVSIMTVHASKGLEFPVVFVPSLVAQRFPSMNRSETIPFPDGLKRELMEAEKTNLAEERRLFYVACTRSKKHLYLTASRYYGDAKRPKKTSQFLAELGFEIEPHEKPKSKKVSSDTDEDVAGVALPKASVLPVFGSERKIPKKLSYSQISAFQTCPRQYEYAYVYKIPGKSSPALSFGITIHNTLKRFYDFLKSKEHPTLFEADEKSKSLLKVLLEMYDSSFIRTDYVNKEHELQAYDVGKKMMETFYGTNGPDFTLPFLLEKSFVLPLGDYVFTGRFDRIDKNSDGTVEVIDYKTGKLKTQRDADNDLQLSLYALACKEALKLEPASLSLYFLDSDTILQTKRTDADINKAREIFLTIAQQMESSDFAPTPELFKCEYCSYKDICDAAILR